MANSNLLRAKIKEYGLNQSEVANRIGISPCTFSYKLNGSREFTASEIYKLSNLLHIKDKDTIFFAGM